MGIRVGLRLIIRLDRGGGGPALVATPDSGLGFRFGFGLGLGLEGGGGSAIVATGFGLGLGIRSQCRLSDRYQP